MAVPVRGPKREPKNRFDRLVESAKQHKTLGAVIFVCLLLTATGNLIESVEKIGELASRMKRATFPSAAPEATHWANATPPPPAPENTLTAAAAKPIDDETCRYLLVEPIFQLNTSMRAATITVDGFGRILIEGEVLGGLLVVMKGYNDGPYLIDVAPVGGPPISKRFAIPPDNDFGLIGVDQLAAKGETVITPKTMKRNEVSIFLARHALTLPKCGDVQVGVTWES